jgi:hypothetical protein
MTRTITVAGVQTSYGEDMQANIAKTIDFVREAARQAIADGHGQYARTHGLPALNEAIGLKKPVVLSWRSTVAEASLAPSAPSPPISTVPRAVRLTAASLTRTRSRFRRSGASTRSSKLPRVSDSPAAPTERPTAMRPIPCARSIWPPSRSRPALSDRSPPALVTSTRRPCPSDWVTTELSSATVRSLTSRPAVMVTSPPDNAPTPEVNSCGTTAIVESSPTRPSRQRWLAEPTRVASSVEAPDS